MRRLHALILVLLLGPVPGSADVRELSQAELRAIVSTNGAIATRRLIAGVEDFTKGDVVDVRAFLIENTVTYRVLIRQANGLLGALMVDGTTGFAVQNDSAVGRQVTEVAAANAASGRSNSIVAQGASKRNSGNNGRSGNSAGNSGRDNNGNGGGNGRGNGNSGGNGNAGNNGNGNGGGKGNGNGRGR